MGDSSCSRGCGFESRRCLLDGHDIFHIDLLYKLYCLFEKTRNKLKRGRSWPFFKKKCVKQIAYLGTYPTFQNKPYILREMIPQSWSSFVKGWSLACNITSPLN